MNNNSQRFKSGGTSFFAFAPARIDAIEEVSVSTTGLGADAGGEGAMQIRMTTKRGSEQYHGKVLYQGDQRSAQRQFVLPEHPGPAAQQSAQAQLLSAPSAARCCRM